MLALIWLIGLDLQLLTVNLARSDKTCLQLQPRCDFPVQAGADSAAQLPLMRVDKRRLRVLAVSPRGRNAPPHPIS